MKEECIKGADFILRIQWHQQEKKKKIKKVRVEGPVITRRCRVELEFN